MIQVVNLQAELTYLQTHLATLELPSPPPPPPSMSSVPPQFSISDLPSASNPASALDLSALFDPLVQAPWSPSPQQQRQQIGRNLGESSGGGDGGDLQALARELLDRHHHGSSSSDHPPLSK